MLLASHYCTSILFVLSICIQITIHSFILVDSFVWDCSFSRGSRGCVGGPGCYCHKRSVSRSVQLLEAIICVSSLRWQELKQFPERKYKLVTKCIIESASTITRLASWRPPLLLMTFFSSSRLLLAFLRCPSAPAGQEKTQISQHLVLRCGTWLDGL